MEGGYGDVAGGAIEGEDEVLDLVIVKLFANGGDEPLVEFLAGLLEFFEVAVCFQEGLEFFDFGGKFFSSDGDGFAFKDDSGFACLTPPDEPEFVVEDEGIDEDGFDFGVGEDDVLGGDRKFCVLQLGGVFDLLIAKKIFQAFNDFFIGIIGFGDLGDQLGFSSTFLSFALGEFSAEGDRFVVSWNDGGFDRVEKLSRWSVSRTSFAGVVAEFLVLEQF